MEKISLPITNLGAVIDVLNDMQRQEIIAAFAIGGAVAAIIHNEPISTFDLDIFFFLTKPAGLILSLEEIYDYAKNHNFSFDSEFINIHGWLVQFVEASHSPLWIEAIEKAVIKIIDNREISVIDVEYLAVMWILAGRKKDIRKIEMFDEAGFMNVELLEDLLKRFDLLEKWKTQQHNFSDEYRF